MIQENVIESQRGTKVSDAGLTLAHFRRIARVLHDDSGIAMPETKLPLVYSRLTKRLRTLKISDFQDYCALIESDAGEAERKHMLAALTTNVTRFFREPHHFQELEKTILPPLAQSAKAGGRLRIWSAGCSSGEEPYSIALSLLSVLPDAANLDVKLLATDIDPNVLARARKGTYPDGSVTEIPAALRKRYVTKAPEGDDVQMSESLQQLITFNELNLIRPWPVKGPFDIIFCRNVVIYFDEPTQHELWRNFARVLKPGGWLFIGHSERVFGTACDDLRPAGITAYQKLG